MDKGFDHTVSARREHSRPGPGAVLVCLTLFGLSAAVITTGAAAYAHGTDRGEAISAFTQPAGLLASPSPSASGAASAQGGALPGAVAEPKTQSKAPVGAGALGAQPWGGSQLDAAGAGAGSAGGSPVESGAGSASGAKAGSASTSGGGAAAAPPAASPTPTPSPSAKPSGGSVEVTGQLSCTSGRPVEGVWVQAGSGSGFAAWKSVENGADADYWYSLPKSEPYALHVGCGGTKATWAMTAYTPQENGTHNSFNCIDVSGQSGYGTCLLR